MKPQPFPDTLLNAKMDTTLRDTFLRGMNALLLLTDRKGNMTYLNDTSLPLPTMDSWQSPENQKIGTLKILIDDSPFDMGTMAENILRNGFKVDICKGMQIQLEQGAVPAWMIAGPLKLSDGSINGMFVLIGESKQGDLILPESAPKAQVLVQDSLFVRKEGEYVRLNVSEVQAVEAMENYVQIVTDKEKFVIHATMKHMQDKLKSFGFIRVHRSFLIPVIKVQSFDDSKVKIGDKTFPIGKSYRADLHNAVNFL